MAVASLRSGQVRHKFGSEGLLNIFKVATAFLNPETEFPEPLITIWEPRSYPVLFQFLTQGYSCPRKVLINSEIELLHLEEHEVLMNVNDREGYEQVKNR